MAEDAVYVVMVIGCLECGNGSRCLGVFPDYATARLAIGDGKRDINRFAKAKDDPWGSFQTRIFEVPPHSASEWQPDADHGFTEEVP